MKKTLLFIAVLLGLAGTAKAQVEWKVWEGPSSDKTTNVFISNTYSSFLEVGDVLYATFEKKNEDETWWNGDVRIGWNTINTNPTFDAESGYMLCEITADILSYMSGNASYTYYTWNDGTSSWGSATKTEAGDIRMTGNNVYFTSLVIKKKNSMIKNVLWSGTHSINNWSGLSVEASKLSGLVDNDYIVCKATKHSDNISINNESVTPSYWLGALQDWSEETPKYQDINCANLDQCFFAKITDASLVSTHAMGVTGYCYDLTEVAYFHPVTSFSIGSIGMATFCANVAVSVPEGIEAYYATVSDNKIVLTKIDDGVIPANTGVIIKGDEGSVVEFTATTTESTCLTNVLTGVTTAKPMTPGDYVLYNNNGTAEFRQVTASNLAANKAYLPAAKLNSTAPALSVVFGDDETTSIATPKTAVVIDDQYYDLSGRRIAQPTKGIYIKNGKKIIVK